VGARIASFATVRGLDREVHSAKKEGRQRCIGIVRRYSKVHASRREENSPHMRVAR